MDRRVAVLSMIIFLCFLLNSAAQQKTIGNIQPPEGYIRTKADEGSFTNYLRKIELKRDKTVFLYNGQKKYNQDIQYAVLNISTGLKNLQQCADACMRLRAEYLKSVNQPVCFADNSGKAYCWKNYLNKGWQTYLEKVFSMCGTLSLEKQLKLQTWQKLSPGDVLIKGGSPGHAVMVLDVAQNPQSGELIFLLGQSFMPAQDIHILLNLKDPNINPWYKVPHSQYLYTPDWSFLSTQLRKW